MVQKVKEYSDALKAERAALKAVGLPCATEEGLKVAPVIANVISNEGTEAAEQALYNVAKNPEIIQAEGNVPKAIKTMANAAHERGKAFEDFLVRKLGGRGSFKVVSKLHGTREFDGAVGNVWYEAKSGEALNAILSDMKKLNHFRERMGTGLKIANQNGAKY